MNELNIIDELKRRNKDALDYVLDKYGKMIYTVAYMELRSHVLSEECLNDVMIKVWLNIDGYSYEKAQFKNWILTIAKYTAIDILRKEKRHFGISEGDLIENEQSEASISVEDDVLSREEVCKVEETINTFSKIDRTIFIERFFVGKEVKEIARELGMTPNSVSIRINKGRKRLRELVKEGICNEK